LFLSLCSFPIVFPLSSFPPFSLLSTPKGKCKALPVL
jgi:hypothetical protein